MEPQQAQRTLVKSAPELWAELSDAESLGRHLGAFGEIRITRLEPETTVAWEGDRTRGTVEIEPSGWGTRVCLTARRVDDAPREDEPAREPDEAEAEPEPENEEAIAEPEPGFLARVWARMRGRAPEAAAEPEPAAEPEAEPAPELDPEPQASPDPETLVVLSDALDALGSARHRPFSRA